MRGAATTFVDLGVPCPAFAELRIRTCEVTRIAAAKNIARRAQRLLLKNTTFRPFETKAELRNPTPLRGVVNGIGLLIGDGALMRFVTLLSLLAFFAIGTPAVAIEAVTSQKIDESALLAWASGRAAEALTFDFEDYERVFERAKRNFTPQGWREFDATLKGSRLLENVVSYQQFAYAEQNLTIAPKIENQGLENGVYQWTVSVPLKESVRAGNKAAARLVIITMTLVEGRAIGLSTMTIVHWEEK